MPAHFEPPYGQGDSGGRPGSTGDAAFRPARRTVLAALGAALPLSAVLAGCADDGDGAQPDPAVPPRPGDRVLNVVAHHDDDLLFLSPNLIQDLQSGAHVRSMYFVASDYRKYPQYMKDREEGVRQAYALALGRKPSEWRFEPYAAGGVQATLWKLGDNVSILETRIPDGFRKTPLGAERLWALYAENKTIATRPGDTFPEQKVNRDALVRYLHEVVAEYRPTVLNTLDPTADLQGTPDAQGGFHQDHIAVSRLVIFAFEGRPGAPQINYFRDYTIDGAPANLAKAQAKLKAKYFHKYTEHDSDAASNKAYDPWLERLYQVDAAWTGDLVIPLPARLDGAARPAPVIGQAYRVVNRETGLELALPAGPPGSAATVEAASAAASHRVVVQAVRRGWALFSADGLCLEIPAGAREPLRTPAMGTPDLEPHQSVRLHGTAEGGHELVFAHSGLALAVRTEGGTPTLVQASGGAARRWDFRPLA
ncbi:PIG-L family deacetylase [Yinghuangia soli]|uniref:PIG-L family deacetylase n=1 Tax=Yinghuangia soli TaxID=2908204 RepID=A0AA41TZ32_9ACTN|nr:PIG-L family deacetylase [Yinghuangia soli]MCF2526830.1 PIG-L family deacetylase [Yinghuangia soli]